MSPLLISLIFAQVPASDGGLSRVTLVFGGDVIPHDPVKYVARARAKTGNEDNNGGWDHVFGPIRPVLERADFAIVNLETPVGWFKTPEKGEMTFNAQPPLIHALKRAGVDVAAFANNHCLDQHREGITSTREFLADAGLLSSGCDINEEAAWKPLVLEKDGMRIGLFVVTRWLNGFNNKLDATLPHVPIVPYDPKAARKDGLPVEPIVGDKKVDDFLELVKKYSAEVDALFVFIHWGAEYKHNPASDDRRLAKLMLDSGAFSVIGMHPHVLQPLEFLEPSAGGKRLVMFSLGNLVSNQDFDKPAGTKKDSLLLELELVKENGVVRLEKTHAVPVATENQLGVGLKRNVQAVLIDEELVAIDDRLTELGARADAAAKSERKELLDRRKLAWDRRARIVTFVPEGVIDPAPVAAAAPTFASDAGVRVATPTPTPPTLPTPTPAPAARP
ncbi:MAG: CapA family protein [Archangium sp.]|nr:CapA family protein [Archangium sp.]